jgi:DnaT DNA-binding domain
MLSAESTPGKCWHQIRWRLIMRSSGLMRSSDQRAPAANTLHRPIAPATNTLSATGRLQNKATRLRLSIDTIQYLLMSSLIPERQLVISPSLATTIGLEEAVLLQVLNDAATFSSATKKQNYLWYCIDGGELMNLLPFWDQPALRRIIKSLQDKGIILIETTQLNAGGQVRFAMNEQQPKRPPAPAHTPVSNRQPKAAARGASLIDEHWQPDEDLLQLMKLNHNIPREFALQQTEDFILYWRDRREVSHSWPSKFRQHLLKQWRFHQSREAKNQAVTNQRSDINQSWKPSFEALEILHRANVTPDFIEDSIPEFVLYWGERGEASSTWNSKFIAHIRRQWAKFTKSLELDYEPRQIAANWQPSEDVYDILRLANIELAFARQLVPEFVLFWRDTQEIQRSWNTKFLQHTKYQWATRHHMEQHYAPQSVSHQSGQRAAQSPFKQLTDRSWAEGIVDGL